MYATPTPRYKNGQGITHRNSPAQRISARPQGEIQDIKPSNPHPFRKIPNVYQHELPHQGMIAKGVRFAAETYSKTAKTHLNFFYCYSCEYNVDHDGWSCPYKKEVHVPNIPGDEVHEYYGAIMKS